VKRKPCIAWDAEGRHCLAGLLLGVACCPDGNCALCEKSRAAMRRTGFTEAEVERRFARSRARLRSRCPTCGCPPPPRLREIPEMPRLDRSDRVLSGSSRCRICEAPLSAGQRHYCSRERWLQRRRNTEGWGDSAPSHAPPRVVRVRLGGPPAFQQVR
jgi:hypothetical protein